MTLNVVKEEFDPKEDLDIFYFLATSTKSLGVSFRLSDFAKLSSIPASLQRNISIISSLCKMNSLSKINIVFCN